MRVFKIVVVAFMLLFMGTVTAQAQEDGAQVSVAALDGKGQVLINPYYNINIATAMNYFRIVNTSDDQGVGVKVRLNRATDSEEVFDFYVCLSAKDEFSGWILPIVEGGVIVGGEIVSADSPNAPETPTYPPIPPATTDCGTCGVIPYRFATGGGFNLEGYMEIISVVAWPETPGVRTVGDSEQCRVVVEEGGANVSYPGNVLIGDMHLIDADYLSDSMFAYNSTALADFRAVGGPEIQGTTLFSDIPNLTNADGGIEAVDAALAKEAAHIMHTTTFRQEGVDTGLFGQTDFIVLFPTMSDSADVTAPIHFKPRKWDNAEHTEVCACFPSPEAAAPRPFPYELNYVRIGPDDLGVLPLFNTNVYWGNMELALIDQNLLDYVQATYVDTGWITQAELAALVPGYEHGHLDITFLNGPYDVFSVNPIVAPVQPQARPAIVLRFEKVDDFQNLQSWTHALEAQYTLPE